MHFLLADDQNDGPAENNASAPPDPDRAEAAEVLGIRRGHAAAADLGVRARRPLARLRLLRHRLHGAADAARAQVQLAGPPGRQVQHALPGARLAQRARPRLQVHHRLLLHHDQPHERRLRQRQSQHHLGEDLLDRGYAPRM